VVHTRIKICGITRPEDARVAVASGADAIGLVFYAGSPRFVNIEQAAEIIAVIPPFVTVVALFVDEPAASVARVLENLSIDMLQFHGEESPEYCRSFNRPWMKALRVRPELDIPELCTQYSGARAMLLDSWQEGVPGGTGKTFDWSLAQGERSSALVLAGGLNEANVADAIAQLNPVAVDVSGGVEAAPGIKDQGKIERFVAAVRAADHSLD